MTFYSERLPTEVYCLTSGYHKKVYVSAGALKSALKTGYRRGAIFKCVIGSEDGWADVTRDFIDEHGKLTW